MLVTTGYWRNAHQNHMRYHLITIRMAIIKKSKKTTDVEKKEHFYTVGGSVNQFNHCGRQCGDSSKS